MLPQSSLCARGPVFSLDVFLLITVRSVMPTLQHFFILNAQKPKTRPYPWCPSSLRPERWDRGQWVCLSRWTRALKTRFYFIFFQSTINHVFSWINVCLISKADEFITKTAIKRNLLDYSLGCLIYSVFCRTLKMTISTGLLALVKPTSSKYK